MKIKNNSIKHKSSNCKRINMLAEVMGKKKNIQSETMKNTYNLIL